MILPQKSLRKGFSALLNNSFGIINLGISIVLFLLLVLGVVSFYILKGNPAGFSPPRPSSRLEVPKRIAFLVASDTQLPAVEGVKLGLSELGYEIDKDVKLDLYNPKGDKKLTKQYALDIIASKPDIVVSASTTATKIMQETRGDLKIPTIFVDVGNLKELGISDIKHPGNSITGVTTDTVSVAEKRIEILKEVIPKAKIFGILMNPDNVNKDEIIAAHEKGSNVLGIKLRYYNLTTKEQIPEVLKQIIRDRPDGLLTTQDALISMNAEMIASSLSNAKIPTIDLNIEKGVNSGYLMALGFSRTDGGKQGARLVDKVLRGEDPSSIPIEFAARQRLEVNLAVARGIGVELPQSILLRAEKKLDN